MECLRDLTNTFLLSPTKYFQITFKLLSCWLSYLDMSFKLIDFRKLWKEELLVHIKAEMNVIDVISCISNFCVYAIYLIASTPVVFLLLLDTNQKGIIFLSKELF